MTGQERFILLGYLLQDTAPKPSLPPEPVEVTERTPVNLSCSAAAPCPELPPNLTWTPSLGEIVHQLQENEDETKYVSSVLTFIASHLHHGQKITCRALYTLQQRNCLRISQATLTLKVLYKPQISGSGSCNRTAAHISCSCETHGNPSPSMEWRVSGLQVTNSTDTVIRKEHLGNTSLRSSLTMSYTKRVTPTVFCLSTNTVGSSSLQLHVPCLQPLLDFFSSLLIGVLVGTLMTCLLWCVALFLKQKMSKNFAKDSQELQVRNATENQTDPAPVQREPSLNLPLKPVEDIYANHQMVASKKREEGQREDSHTPRLTPTMTQGQAGEDTLHYASVKFTARKTDKETAATARPIYDNV